MMYPKPKLKKHKTETVSDETYDTVLERDKRCRLCGSTNWLQLHHIVYRSQDKTKINDISNCIILCLKCHNLVHSNKREYMSKLKELTK